MSQDMWHLDCQRKLSARRIEVVQVRETEVLNRGNVHMVLGKDLEGSGRDIRNLWKRVLQLG